jgi:hypothetical protein
VRQVVCIAALCLVAPIFAPAASAQSEPKRAYETACAACHGSDGRGDPAAASQYPLVPPDFTDCRFASREPDTDWIAISHGGGPARGFSRLMPAFGEALDLGTIEKAIDHIRSLCTDSSWPRGELNLPRALVTEKAFPEDEAVLTVVTAKGAVTNKLVYERRFGARNQIELVMPLAFADRGGGDWSGGVGDLAFAVKRAVFHDVRRGSILSGAVELVVPTGRSERGIGGGTTVLEPFVAFGQILPADAFVQVQAGGGFPFGRDHHDELFWRGAIGRSFTQGAFGRSWSPIVEIVGARELGSGNGSQWDIVPQMQVTLSTRQHVMFSAGVRIPANQREGRSTQVMVYLLWDWFDGGFLTGW